MIFGHENISTYTRTNMCIWMTLAFQAGLLNIGGFMACHSFVSHVTGFATLFGIELGVANYADALGLLLVPLCFLVGAMLSAVLIDLQIKLGRKPKYYVVFGALFILILTVEIGGFNHVWGEFGEPMTRARDFTLLGMLCLICGLQNAMVSMVSRSVVRTTHLTGILTDLGIGLVRMFNRRFLRVGVEEEGRANLMRAGIILFFMLGSVTGYRMFRDLGFRGFLFPTIISGLLFVLTLYFQVLRRTPPDAARG